MTRTKYIITRFTQYFGAFNRNKHLNAAASETQLYVDAQRFFGAKIWEHVEEIDALSAEYWTLRNLISEREGLMESLQKTQVTLNDTQEVREKTVARWKEEVEDLEEQRKEAITTLGRIRTEVHQNRDDGKQTKKSYEGMKMQLKVLGDGEEQDSGRKAVEDRMAGLRLKFEELKETNIKLIEALRNQETVLKNTEERIAKLRESLKERAMKTYSTIGQANQETTQVKSKVRRLENEISRLQVNIGRYILANYRKDPQVRKIARKQRLFFSQIQMLESSINYHQRLADLV